TRARRRRARHSGRRVARPPAAHSTATLNDTSSCRFIESGPVRHVLYGTPMVGGPRTITVGREEQQGGQILRTSHDGYADIFNVLHHRVLLLANDGQRLDGEDTLTPVKGDSVPAARDHVH